MLAWDELAQLDGLGGSIRARRIELGWTQSELAERSGVPVGSSAVGGAGEHGGVHVLDELVGLLEQRSVP